MFDKLEDLLIRYEEIMGELQEPDVVNDQSRFRKLMKEQNDLTPIVEAYKELGLEYAFEPIRGGTDGAHLTYRGLPCPNLATGDYNCHGRFEYVDVDEMKKMIEVVYKIVTK